MTEIVVAKDGSGGTSEVAVSEQERDGALFLVLDVGNGVEDGRVRLTPRDAAIVGAQLIQWAFVNGMSAADTATAAAEEGTDGN